MKSSETAAIYSEADFKHDVEFINTALLLNDSSSIKREMAEAVTRVIYHVANADMEYLPTVHKTNKFYINGWRNCAIVKDDETKIFLDYGNKTVSGFIATVAHETIHTIATLRSTSVPFSKQDFSRKVFHETASDVFGYYYLKRAGINITPDTYCEMDVLKDTPKGQIESCLREGYFTAQYRKYLIKQYGDSAVEDAERMFTDAIENMNAQRLGYKIGGFLEFDDPIKTEDASYRVNLPDLVGRDIYTQTINERKHGKLLGRYI